MRSSLLAGIATAAILAAAVPASAADLSRPYGYAAAPAPFSWTGFYVGANVGYGWGSTNFDSPDGFVGGFQGGYNYQFGNPFVLGIEGDFAFSGIDGGTFSADYLSTIRARAGVAFDRFFLYGTGGIAFTGGSLNVAGFTTDKSQTGWTLGVGGEYAIDRNWSAKAEYLYVDLGSVTFPTVIGPMNTGFDANILRGGVNYRF